MLAKGANAQRFMLRSQQQLAHVKVNPAQAIMMVNAHRQFSSFEQIEKASQKLGKALDSEIKYENENYTQLEDIETFLNESGFLFNESEDGLSMTLTKEVGDKKVEVVFEAR